MSTATTSCRRAELHRRAARRGDAEDAPSRARTRARSIAASSYMRPNRILLGPRARVEAAALPRLCSAALDVSSSRAGWPTTHASTRKAKFFTTIPARVVDEVARPHEAVGVERDEQHRLGDRAGERRDAAERPERRARLSTRPSA